MITPLEEEVTNLVEVEFLPDFKHILGEIEPKILSNLGASLYARQLAIHLNVSNQLIGLFDILLSSLNHILIIIILSTTSLHLKSMSEDNVKASSTKSLMSLIGLSACAASREFERDWMKLENQLLATIQ